MKPEKMTDDDVAEVLRGLRRYNLPGWVYRDADRLSAHIAALTAERDEAKRMHAANVEAGCELAKAFDKAKVGSPADGVFIRCRALLALVGELRERVQALEVERDDFQEQATRHHAHNVSLVAERNAAWKDADALRERVRTLDAERERLQKLCNQDADAKIHAQNAATARGWRLDAIRERAMDVVEGRAPKHVYASETRRAAYVLGEDCTCPNFPREMGDACPKHLGARPQVSELDGLDGEMVGLCEPSTVKASLKLDSNSESTTAILERPCCGGTGWTKGALCPWCSDCSTSAETARTVPVLPVDDVADREMTALVAEQPKSPARGPIGAPTTVEAFATVRSEVEARARELRGIEPYGGRAQRAASSLFLLERRMGAMVRAARLVLGCGGAAGFDELRAALTDAPPVFTLEEVDDAWDRAKARMLGDDGIANLHEYLGEELRALRKVTP